MATHNFMVHFITLVFRSNLNKYVSWRPCVNFCLCLETFVHIMTRLKRPFRQRGALPRRYYIKVILALILGIIFGLIFSFITRRYFVGVANVKCKPVKTNTVKSTLATRSVTRQSIRQDARHLNIATELKLTKYFLLIGIMTAEHFISTRAKTIQDTWAKSVPSVKVVFFSGEEGNKSLEFDLVRLPEVDDTYPPQKKSFHMLKYVYDHYINEFHWFLRADDDVYIQSDKLSEVLLGFDSSESLLFGHAGVGKSHEKGKLGLEEGDNFCIGGVGVIMSQSLMRKMAPYWLTCLNQTASLHEDVELGRCIRKHVGVMCPWAQEVQHMFYQNFEKPEKVFAGSLDKSPFRNAITVHPIKERSYMLQLHHHVITSGFLRLQHRAAILNQRQLKTRNLLRNSTNKKSRYFQKSYFYGLLQGNSTIQWEFTNMQYVYGLSEPPMTWVSGPVAEGMRKLKNGVMSNINSEAHRLLKTKEEFKKFHLATLRTHPKFGVQITVDLETLLRSTVSTRKRMPRYARHFSHFQQSFAPLWKNTLSEISFTNNHKSSIYFIVPLAGRFDTFVRFLNSFEESFIIPGLSVGLLVVYFPDVYSSESHRKIFGEFRAKYPEVELTLSELFGEFSRSRALMYGVHRHGNNSLLFFADVDLIFETGFYYRCQAGAILGERLYFPIMFSQFNPQIVYHNQAAPPGYASNKPISRGSARIFTRREGVWRKYSYGPVCVYSNDVIAVGGLNTTIRAWGLEDLDFYEKCLRHNLEVFRAPDPGLVHVYHTQTNCLDPRMNSEQAKMCEDSRRRGIGSEESLVDYMLSKGYL